MKSLTALNIIGVYHHIRSQTLKQIFIMLLSLIIIQSVAQAHSTAFSDVSESHWAWKNGIITWGLERQIVSGYEDGTFKPNQFVTEPEFLVMLLRAFPEVKLPTVDNNSPWHEPYYRLADDYHWPVIDDRDGATFNRGSVAVLLAATQGQSLSYHESIQYVLDHGLAHGKTASTVEGYAPDDPLTRAEALSLIKNISELGLSLHRVANDEETEDSQVAEQAVRNEFSVRNVKIGNTVQEVIAELGKPDREDVSMYGFTWYIYNQDYTNYAQIGISDGRVVAMYSNVDNWQSKSGVKLGTSHEEFEAIYGERVQYITKGTTAYAQNLNYVYLIDQCYVTVFVDEYDGHNISSIFIIDEPTELAFKQYLPEPSEELERAYERQIFDLANATRVRFGLRALTWDDQVANTAKKHSQDMAEHHYMGHVDSNGRSPWDRMAADNISYGTAAENVAANQRNAFYVHDAWMNSEGHRRNLLNKSVTRLGVGVAFSDGKYKVYYTQKFYLPR